MSITNYSREKLRSLPQELVTAQEAIYLPEVQEMLRKLAEYNLGIFMPHMHDDQTGEFQPLPTEVVQVEDGLKVSFRAGTEVEDGNQYFPTGWFWRKDAPLPSAVCVQRCRTRPPDTNHYSVHEKEDW
jgi:hypothetical protein